VAEALTTLGRTVKTIYILRYIHEENLRRRVHLKLNRGESRHALARWLFFANRGEFRSGDYEEIMNKASCLSLLSNVVLVWNTMAVMKMIGQLRAAGETYLGRRPGAHLASDVPARHSQRYLSFCLLPKLVAALRAHDNAIQVESGKRAA
jgi:Tn3 transposase DDE domain-containing protein